MDYFNISGKKAIVTGGSRGLGRGMAEGLMNTGVEVVLFATTPRIKEIAENYTKKGFKCKGISVDIGNQEESKKAFNEALKFLGGKIDILVNAAGVQRRHKSEEFPLEDWNTVIDVNLTAVFSLCQLAAKEMIKQKSGKIINIASMLSYFGGYTVPAYAASKGGVAQLTKAFANEWASHGINVNAIAPGYMDTEMNTALINDEKRNEEILARIPAKRWGKPEDMAGVVLFLASPASDYLNGAIIPVDGGYLGR
ncbi:MULTISPECIES: 3-oxoacyl-ACP reductase FabG [unclassified Sedimentibacter]|uniref:3-oxoacyl-ACP reductase FabG n=1 Tax=unclassified Sedimentibacter TaxID=2649220 RepID=UPI0027DEDB52|nr:3-oxoacyl-ACP reductase FabG [Sedimentibacter sp. MB35-C1]WMJ77546.1 3-oxoacyl-ACP reductase FabG [Sedimentibacter sp. MB35-C1]